MEIKTSLPRSLEPVRDMEVSLETHHRVYKHEILGRKQFITLTHFLSSSLIQIPFI